MRERPGFHTGAIAGYLIVGLLGGIVGGLLVGWMLRAGVAPPGSMTSALPYAEAPRPATGDDDNAVTQAVKLVGSVLSTVFERVTHFSRNHLRTTDGIDRVQATHVECEAEQLARISGQHLLLNGQNLVKARGGQIHFG